MHLGIILNVVLPEQVEALRVVHCTKRDVPSSWRTFDPRAPNF
jgi:hypothetical protein